MTIFAYCRVSTLDQNSMMQEDAILKAYPSAIVRHEKKSGNSRTGRDVLSLLLDMLSKGDRLVVWKLDRLARNMADLLNIVELIESKGAMLEILDQRLDTSTASGRAFLQMLGVFAEFETNLRQERQAAGIAKAKLERPEVYSGRPATIDSEAIRKLLGEGFKPVEVAQRLGISRASVYRYKSKCLL